MPLLSEMAKELFALERHLQRIESSVCSLTNQLDSKGQKAGPTRQRDLETVRQEMRRMARTLQKMYEEAL